MKAIVPPSALFVILQFWSTVLHLVSAVWYERQQQRYRHHWLVQFDQVADLTPIEQGCAAFHADSGRGSAGGAFYCPAGAGFAYQTSA